jgi:hypothetical protein
LTRPYYVDIIEVSIVHHIPEGLVMPGRYLVIEFDDDQDADKLRAQIDEATKKGRSYRAVGLFARPGKVCICSNIAAERGRSRDNVIRGAKFGWWLCTKCHRPRLGNHELKNLIPQTDIIEPTLVEGVDVYARMPDLKNYTRYPLIMGVVTYPEEVALKRTA